MEFVYVECSFIELYTGQAVAGEVVEWLGKRGFRFAGFGNFIIGPSAVGVQADLLFRRMENGVEVLR
jgi:hypothetical protein